MSSVEGNDCELYTLMKCVTAHVEYCTLQRYTQYNNSVWTKKSAIRHKARLAYQRSERRQPRHHARPLQPFALRAVIGDCSPATATAAMAYRHFRQAHTPG